MSSNVQYSPSSPTYSPTTYGRPLFNEGFDFRTLRSPSKKLLDMAVRQVYAILHATTIGRAPFSSGAPTPQSTASSDVLLIKAGTYPGLDYEVLRARLIAENRTFEGLLHCTDGGDFVFRYAGGA